MRRFFAPNRVLQAAACLLALATAVPAYVGQWHSYTNQQIITSLIVHDGLVFAGTQGGIRSIHPVTLRQREFDNLDGLLDVWVTGLARDSAGTLWAVSRNGYVHSLTRNGRRWEASGRSYAAQGWRMNDRAVLAAGDHLYLGSLKGLAVYSTGKKVSELNITRFRDAIDVSVRSLLRRGDTLYVGTEAGVFKAPVDFADPVNPDQGAGFANIADHNQWIAVDADTTAGGTFEHLAFVGDTLKAFRAGTLLQAPVRVEAFADTSTPLRIGTQAYPPSMYGFVAAVYTQGRVFAGGLFDLAISRNPAGDSLDADFVRSERRFPRDTVANIGANNGRVRAHSPAGLWNVNALGWFDFIETPLYTPSHELYVRFLRNVVVDDNWDTYIASWGTGLVRVRDDGSRSWKNSESSPPTCLYAPTPGNDFTVAHSISRPRGNNLYFTIFKGEGVGDHQLAHLNLQTDVISCLETNAPGGTPHAVHAFSDTLLGIATNDGLVLYKTRGGATAPITEPMGVWTVTGSGNQAWDLATDRWGRPWAIFASGLAYVDSLDNSQSQRLGFVDNFIGQNCRSLEADPAGLLWVGCDNGLFHVRTEPDGSVANVRRYGIDDGLLSLYIYDVSVDPSNGRVWIATDRGVSMFESASHPEVPKGRLENIIPYPNPFRPHHAFVILDNLPSNATVRIHSPSGNVVRIFQPRDLLGSRIQWDGNNESGRRVAAGVYTYSVTSGSSVVRGRIIVAR